MVAFIAYIVSFGLLWILKLIWSFGLACIYKRFSKTIFFLVQCACYFFSAVDLMKTKKWRKNKELKSESNAMFRTISFRKCRLHTQLYGQKELLNIGTSYKNCMVYSGFGITKVVVFFSHSMYLAFLESNWMLRFYEWKILDFFSTLIINPDQWILGTFICNGPTHIFGWLSKCDQREKMTEKEKEGGIAQQKRNNLWKMTAYEWKPRNLSIRRLRRQ